MIRAPTAAAGEHPAVLDERPVQQGLLGFGLVAAGRASHHGLPRAQKGVSTSSLTGSPSREPVTRA